jgi:hypothetical protein
MAGRGSGLAGLLLCILPIVLTGPYLPFLLYNGSRELCKGHKEWNSDLCLV